MKKTKMNPWRAKFNKWTAHDKKSVVKATLFLPQFFK